MRAGPSGVVVGTYASISVRRKTSVVAALAIALGVVAVPASPAYAVGSTPAPAGDTYQVVDKDAFDVLSNDSDPDVQLLTVFSNTQPSHGTATCLPTGACTYTAANGYEGSDEFTYTVRDPDNNSATATVSITVTGAPVVANPPTPAPDEIVTKAGVAVTANVLANDQHGANARVVKGSGPSHGTATCTSAGSCTYTPSAGFVGFDGFGYDVTDDFGTSHGTALITVVAAAAGYQQVAAGRPPAIVQGDTATWSVGAKPVPSGLPQQWAAANPPPTTTVSLTGPHAYATTAPTTAPNWTTASPAGTRAFTPGAGALLGESTTNPLPPPLPPISQGTGGDGHVPILIGSKVYAFFHHSSPTSVTCIDRTTGVLCPGYPHLLNVGSSDVIGPAAVVGSKIYVHAQPSSSYEQSAPIALYCWDAAVDETCGLFILDRVLGQAFEPAGSAPRLVSGKVYLATDGGVVHCFDPATGAVCPGGTIADGLPATDATYDVVAHGTRLYIGQRAGAVACVDVVAKATCPGWSTPKELGSPDIVNHHSVTGVADGVCAVSNTSGTCVLDTTPGTLSSLSGWPITDDYYSITEEAEAGTRTLFTPGFDGGLYCWDWTTNALCTGGRWVGGGISTDPSGDALPSAYGAAFDGTCAVALGDPGQVFTVDPAGFSPCTSLSAGAIRRSVDLRNQRCDGTVGAATWGNIQLFEADLVAGRDFNSLLVTVRDGATNQVLATREMVATSGILDLSTISATAHPSLTIDATADSPAGNAAWADGNPPRLVLSWNSDVAQGCFQTTTTPDCAVSTAVPIGVTSTPASGTPVTASLSLLPRTDCKSLTVSKTGAGAAAGTVTSTPGGISCGATCTARYLSGTSVTLTAAAGAGSVFVGWSGGGCAGTAVCVVAPTADTTVTANFAVGRTLTVTKAGGGAGTVGSSPAGISCGATCSAQFTDGTPVTLTAAPSAGSVFTGWSGGGCAGTGTCVTTLSANTTITASFQLLRTLTVTKTGAGSGTVMSTPAGVNCGATCSAQFADGASVTLTASAAAGSVFTGWSGAGCSGTGTCVVTLAADTSVSANFALLRSLTVAKAGTGSGTVTSNPAGIDCGSTCSAQFADGSSVTLTATPAAGSVFTGWTGACTGTGTCVVTLAGATSVTATFELQRTLTVSKTGSGSGTITSSPAGINCGATCSAPFVNATGVALTATPAAGTVFAGWSGGGCAGTGSCVVAMTAATAVTATFALSRTLTVSKTGTGSGAVASNPAGINCGTTCTTTYIDGMSVTLTATPAAGSTFTGWSGACTGTGVCIVTLGADAAVTATFVSIQPAFTVDKSGTGSGTVTSIPAGINCGATCQAAYPSGTTVTLTATPAAGSRFTGWSGGGCSGTGTCVVVVTDDTAVTAAFSALQPTLTVTKSGLGTVTSAPAGINCGTTCEAQFTSGTVVTLTATAAAGSRFSGWTLGGCSGTGTCTVTLAADTSVNATFVLVHTLTVTKSGTGSGTVTSTPAGVSCGATCSATFDTGLSVTLTASPTSGAMFTGWSGGGCTGTGTCVVSVTADTSVTATFAPLRSVTVAKTGTGTGTVTSAPAAINCGATCSASFVDGTSVTLTATPAAGSSFTGWSGGGCSGTGACAVVLSADVTVTATFANTRQPILTVLRNGSGLGGVTSNPGGVLCDPTCSAAYPSGTTITLKAPAAAGSVFTGWSGGGCSGTGTCVVVLIADTTVTATFTPLRTLTVVRAGTGAGSITSTPAGIDCGATCATNKAHGTSIALTATPAVGSVFSRWSGGGCSGTGPCVITLTSNVTVTATFTLIQRTLSVTRAGLGHGTVTSSPVGISCGTTCTKTFPHGTTVTLTATPAGGSRFTGWSGTCSGAGTCVMTLTANAAVTASFADMSVPLVRMTAPTAYFTRTRPIAISWSASDNSSGVASVQVRYQRTPSGGGGASAWVYPSSWTSLAGSSVTFTSPLSGYKYCFAAQAKDRAGLLSAWSAAVCTRVPLDDHPLVQSTGWTRVTGQAGYFDGTYHNTTRLNATLKTGSLTLNRVGIVATTCRTCGVVDVYVGARRVARVSLASTTTTAHNLLVPAAFSTRTGVITLKVVSSGKTVRIDAIGYATS